MSFRSIIDGLGGVTAVQRALGHANRTTVQGWYQRNAVPVKQWPALIAAFASAPVKVTRDDLTAAACAPSDSSPA
jgi:hypothetical protein